VYGGVNPSQKPRFVAILKTTQRCYSNPAKYTMANRVHHFKLVLLGDTAVGKSCLVVRFVRDEFFEFQEPTIGGVYNDNIVDGIHYYFYVIPTRHEIQQECFKESGANLQKWPLSILAAAAQNILV
jgi:hypothetical protein